MSKPNQDNLNKIMRDELPFELDQDNYLGTPRHNGESERLTHTQNQDSLKLLQAYACNIEGTRAPIDMMNYTYNTEDIIKPEHLFLQSFKKQSITPNSQSIVAEENEFESSIKDDQNAKRAQFVASEKDEFPTGPIDSYTQTQIISNFIRENHQLKLSLNLL